VQPKARGARPEEPVEHRAKEPDTAEQPFAVRPAQRRSPWETLIPAELQDDPFATAGRDTPAARDLGTGGIDAPNATGGGWVEGLATLPVCL
jgi:hypothetical protein